MLKVRIPAQQRFILDGISWERYTRLLRLFSKRHLRMTYDRGFLEIMTLSHEHESLAEFLGRLIITATEELGLPIKAGGSTTFRKKRKHKGLEPDHCFWIAREAEVRGKTKIDLRRDPPPDLAVEVDVSRSSMDRMRIYASLGVPEVWRYQESGFVFCRLGDDRQYAAMPTSPSFPVSIAPADLLPFIDMRSQFDENAVIRQFRAWIQAKLKSAPSL